MNRAYIWILWIWCRFIAKDMVTNVNNSKSSVQKGIRGQVLEQFPHIEDYIDQVLPKKEALRIVKWLVKCTFRFVHVYNLCKTFVCVLLFMQLMLPFMPYEVWLWTSANRCSHMRVIHLNFFRMIVEDPYWSPSCSGQTQSTLFLYLTLTIILSLLV